MQIPKIENSLSINQNRTHNEASLSVASIHPKLNFEGEKHKDASKIAKWVGNGFYFAAICSSIIALLSVSRGFGGLVGENASLLLGKDTAKAIQAGDAGLKVVSVFSSVVLFLFGVVCHPKGDV